MENIQEMKTKEKIRRSWIIMRHDSGPSFAFISPIFLFSYITYTKILRCQCDSHILSTLIWAWWACQVRSLLVIFRSQEICCCTFWLFPFQIPHRLVKVPSAFVGGTPLICALQHCVGSHFSICHLWQFVLCLFFPFHLIMSREPITQQSQCIWDTSYWHRTIWRLPEDANMIPKFCKPWSGHNECAK